MSRLVIVSGPPGAGKSTVARALAEGAAEDLAIHLHTDDFYAYIRKGFVAPWKPQAQAQNITVMRALAAAAAAYVQDGYETLIDGIVGPWFFEPWLRAAREHGFDLRYVALIPSEAETVARATTRTTPGAMTNEAVVRTMWQAFRQYPPPPANTLDTGGEPIEATVARVRLALDQGGLRLS